MNVNNVAPAAPAPRASGGSSAADLGYESFLKLLVEQMKYQDPTNPVSSTDYMAQLATFSQVEQSVRSNSKLDALLASAALSTAGSVIGHTVTSADGTVSGVVTSVAVTSEGAVGQLADGGQVLLGPGIVVS